MKRLLLTMMVLGSSFLQLRATVILSDAFDYLDGALVTVSGAKWATHSGTVGQAEVSAGQLQLTQTESEDVSALLAGQPYVPADGATLYVKCTVNFRELPRGEGGYFAHFSAASSQRGRIFATTNGAAAGSFRVGVSAAAASPSAVIDTDLSLNTRYVLVCRFSVGDTLTTLWLDPATESDPSVVATDSGSAVSITAFAFRQSLSSGNGMGTLAVDDLLVGTSFADMVPITSGPPVITTPLEDKTATEGQPVTFTVSAGGEPPLGYQWQHEGTNLVDETRPSLALTAVTTNHAGAYTVMVSNALGSATNTAWLTVLPRPPAVATNLAHLRTLVDNVDFLPTDTTTLFAVEGVVTTHTNLSVATDALFFLQDDTAGMAVFVNGGGNVRPAAGDRLRVTGPLGHLHGLLQLSLDTANPEHSVETLSRGNPLPSAMPLEFGWQDDPSLMELCEGSYVVASNVFLDLSPGANFTAGSNVTLTNVAGQTFPLRIDSRVTDLIGRPKPTSAVTIYGVLSQNDPSAPHTAGYQLLPSGAIDLVAPRLPMIRFTNALENLVRPGDSLLSSTFTEYALRPTERLTVRASAIDDLGRDVCLQAVTNDLPAAATWTFDGQPLPNPSATLSFVPRTADAGSNYLFTLRAANQEGTHTAVWSVYVPTAVEQRVAISEFLANPATDPAASRYNPLHRDVPSPPNAIATEDEYVELVNLAAEAVDLADWTISDAVAVRHTFVAGDRLSVSNAVVIHGGQTFGSEPQLPAGVLAFPASGGSAGLALNNGGDTIVVRNASGRIVERVVYGNVSAFSGSATRHPTLAGGFTDHSSVSTNVVSPGTQNDGRAFSEPAPLEPGALRLSGERVGASLVLRWAAEPGRDYAVEQSDTVNGTFSEVATELRFVTSQGEFPVPDFSASPARFFRVRTP